MIQDKHLGFLCDKMKQLRTAIFTNFSTALLRFQVSVVEVCVTDDEGNLWFMVKKPYECIKDFDPSFPAQLHFFNKQYDYRITAHGKAVIVNESDVPASMLSINTKMKRQCAIIKLKILNAEYCFNKKSTSNHLKDFINNLINKIISNEDAILYRF